MPPAKADQVPVLQPQLKVFSKRYDVMHRKIRKTDDPFRQADSAHPEVSEPYLFPFAIPGVAAPEGVLPAISFAAPQTLRTNCPVFMDSPAILTASLHTCTSLSTQKGSIISDTAFLLGGSPIKLFAFIGSLYYSTG